MATAAYGIRRVRHPPPGPAGGVALNCVANGKVIDAGIFDEVWVQPA
ncbi:carbamoyltransferase N-terminal domain-containing protein, partial [Streptomyces bacillaris]